MKIQMKEKIICYKKQLFRLLGIVFGIIGAVSVFLPIQLSVMEGMEILGIILLVVAIVAACMTVFAISRKSREVYSVGKTKIIFEYMDMKDVLAMEDKTQDNYTVVIPINTFLNLVGDRSIVKKNSIHKLWLDHLFEKSGVEFERSVLENAKVKKTSADFTATEPIGRIGDWFFLTASDIGYETNVRFLLLEVNNLKDKNGKKIVSELSKEQYIVGIQSLIEAIPDVLELEEKVYMPLIGAGNANVGKSPDIMDIMESMLRFNKGILRQEIHVVLNEKYKDETPLYLLKEI